MFKEPDRARLEDHKGLGRDGQVMVTDYSKHRRLTLRPSEKVADVQDTSTMYEVDQQTGQLLPASLDTEARDQVLKLTAESVKDLGRKQLDDGRTVRVLQSTGKKSGSVRTVYVDPDTNLPVQIVIDWPQAKGSKWTYADIKIDQELDDKLFSLEIPAGYQPFNGGAAYLPAPDHLAKMMTKMRTLIMKCIEYANDHNGEWPADLKELTQADGDAKVNEKALKALLAAPEQSDGPAVIVYRKPPKDPKDTGTTIVLYEKPEVRSDKKVAVGLMDGHGEVMTEEYFAELMKKQPQ
jgi:outer membrane lipoprotein-sorting protein